MKPGRRELRRAQHYRCIGDPVDQLRLDPIDGGVGVPVAHDHHAEPALARDLLDLCDQSERPRVQRGVRRDRDQVDPVAGEHPTGSGSGVVERAHRLPHPLGDLGRRGVLPIAPPTRHVRHRRHRDPGSPSHIGLGALSHSLAHPPAFCRLRHDHVNIEAIFFVATG